MSGRQDIGELTIPLGDKVSVTLGTAELVTIIQGAAMSKTVARAIALGQEPHLVLHVSLAWGLPKS